MDWNENGFLKKRKPMDLWEREFIKISSIKLPDGGDTHFHPWKLEKMGLTVTTRLPNPFSRRDLDRKDFPDPIDDFSVDIKIKPRDLPPASDIIGRRLSRTKFSAFPNLLPLPSPLLLPEKISTPELKIPTLDMPISKPYTPEFGVIDLLNQIYGRRPWESGPAPKLHCTQCLLPPIIGDPMK